MADVKAKAVAKPVAKTEAAKAVETKTAKLAETKEVAAKVEVKTEKKAEPKKTAAKAPAKKEAAAKAPAKKATATKKETKAEVKAGITLEFDEKSYTTEKLVEIAKDVWVYDLGKDLKDFRTVELYVKPAESTVYYVVNEEVTGCFGI